MSKKVILVVDDESTNITIVANILSELYDIKIATSGYVALKILDKEKIDLILLDVVMPKMSGYEVASEVLANEKTKMIPFIFLTSLTNPEHIKEGFEYGAVDYISKPFSKEELQARVLTHIRINSLQKSLAKTVDNLNDKIIEVEKHKKEFESIFQYSNDGIAIVDLDTKFLNFNKAYLEMTGYTEDELYEKRCLELTTGEDRERSEVIFEQVLKTEAVKNFEKTCIVNDEKLIHTNVSISLLPDKMRFLLVAKDVSSLKKIEEHDRIVSLSEFVQHIAHQWRQPLSMISTMASGMKVAQEYGLLKENQIAKNMDMIVSQTEYLSNTINDFSHRVSLDSEIKNISLVTLIKEMISLIEYSLKYSKITLKTDFDADMIIECYKSEVIEALINIINNAKDSLEKNRQETKDRYLLISTVQKEDSTIELKIIDSGGGVEDSVKHRIFEPYITTKHQSLGTGMGLNETYKILSEKHHYPIDVYNKEFEVDGQQLKGFCFSVFFSASMD